MTLREYAKLMNDTALQGSLSNEEYNRPYNPLLHGIQSMIPPMLFRYRSCNELSLQALWDDKIWLSMMIMMRCCILIKQKSPRTFYRL